MSYENGLLEQGEKAYEKGKKLTDNPYDEGSVAFKQWKQGWQYAEYQAS